MSGGEPTTLAADAAVLAAAARAVGRPGWADAAESLAGAHPAPPASATPTYRDLALAGVTVVLGLAQAGRWDESATQAEHLATYFHEAREQLDVVADQGFRGLAGAAAGRDPEALGDFAGLLIELFAP